MIKASMSTTLAVALFSLLFSLSLAANSVPVLHSFLQCLPTRSCRAYPINQAVYTATNSSFQSTLQAYITNRRFLTPATPKPLAIITALHQSHVQATVVCAKSSGLQIRIRSGGHDYEGLSYVSDVPFVILDMFNLRSITIDEANKTAWVQAGATTGELYYKIANTSNVLAFPAGVCTSLGTGGHFSGGGYGPLMRKYGLSVDNIVDAQLVDVNGRILNRKSMGEDVFWAIRGGGGASFGVILSWKINLVRVPPTVTVFNVDRTLDEGATNVVYRWQQVASKLDKEIFIRAQIQVVNGTLQGEKTVKVSFIGMFLGRKDGLLTLMKEKFPELGLRIKDCIEMSWIESTLFWFGIPGGTSIDVLLDRPSSQTPKHFFKRRSDYVKEVIPKNGLQTIWNTMMKIETIWMQWNPYGGRMDEISATETPFPHRAGYLFKVQYSTDWNEEGLEATNRYLGLSRAMFDAMTPYVSKNPREAFLNYRDLDIGKSLSNYTSDFQASATYGRKYFRGNFLRLKKAKVEIDPRNFFKNEQSIPALHYHI